MFRLILASIFALVALFALVAALLGPKDDNGRPKVSYAPGVICLLLALVFGGWSTVRVVSANEVGVPTTFGRIGSPLQSGFHTMAPWTEVTSFSTRVQELSMLRATDKGDQAKDDAVEVIAKGGGSMKVDTTIRWSVDPAAIDTLFRQAGTLDLVQQRFVRPDAREVIRNVFGQHSAEGGYSTERAQIAAEILAQLKEVALPRGIIIDSVNVRDVNPEPQVMDGINAIIAQRNLAAQATESQKTELINAETRRQKAIVDADAQVAAAQGIADSQRIAAQAEADSNALVAASLTPELLHLQEVKACADAVAQTSAAVVSCGGTTSAAGSTPAASVIVDGRP